jgi:tRNA modification GTPase
VEVVDTAGLREAGDLVEAEGIRRALEAGREADLVLEVSAVNDPGSRRVGDYFQGDPAGPARVKVLNKVDLAEDPGRTEAAARASGMIPVSALTGYGAAELKDAIGKAVGFAPGGSVFTARKRHLAALEAARGASERALALARDALPGELIAEELKAVHGALGEIVGEVTSDELLGEIFSRFCIGK